MLCIELRRPIIPPRSITVADNKTSPCSLRPLDRLPASAAFTYHPSFFSPYSFSAAACCLRTGSSVNRLFTGFEGVGCFDLSGFVCLCAFRGRHCTLQVPEDNCITVKGRHFKYAWMNKKPQTLTRPTRV